MKDKNLEQKKIVAIRRELGIENDAKIEQIAWPKYLNVTSWSGTDIPRLDEEFEYLEKILAYIISNPDQELIELLYDRLMKVKEIRGKAYGSRVICPF